MTLDQLRLEMSRTADPFAAEAYLNRLLKEEQNGLGSSTATDTRAVEANRTS